MIIIARNALFLWFFIIYLLNFIPKLMIRKNFFISTHDFLTKSYLFLCKILNFKDRCFIDFFKKNTVFFNKNILFCDFFTVFLINRLTGVIFENFVIFFRFWVYLSNKNKAFSKKPHILVRKFRRETPFVQISLLIEYQR